jgi:DNA polymerase III delta prime subunit
MSTNPSQWKPANVSELIGEARRVGRILSAKIDRLQSDPDAVFRCLFYGVSGTGKTSLTNLLAKQLVGVDEFSLTRKAGQDVSIDTVREWEASLRSRPLFGDWQVIQVNEIDLMPPAAQHRLLEFLDLLPARYAFLGTSNLELELLAERFQTRLQPWKIEPPSTEETIGFIRKHWPLVTVASAKMIAVGSAGNVRAACLDTESELDVLLADAA